MHTIVQDMHGPDSNQDQRTVSTLCFGRDTGSCSWTGSNRGMFHLNQKISRRLTIYKARERQSTSVSHPCDWTETDARGTRRSGSNSHLESDHRKRPLLVSKATSRRLSRKTITNARALKHVRRIGRRSLSQL